MSPVFSLRRERGRSKHPLCAIKSTAINRFKCSLGLVVGRHALALTVSDETRVRPPRLPPPTHSPQASHKPSSLSTCQFCLIIAHRKKNNTDEECCCGLDSLLLPDDWVVVVVVLRLQCHPPPHFTATATTAHPPRLLRPMVVPCRQRCSSV